MKHIRLYLITLFIACSMFMVCPFACASDYSNVSSLSDILDFIIDLSDSKKETIINTFNDYCPSYQVYFDESTQSLICTGSDIPGQYITCLFNDVTPMYGGGTFYFYNSDVVPTYVYRLFIHNNDVSLIKFIPTNENGTFSINNTSFSSVYGITLIQKTYFVSDRIITDSVSTSFYNSSTNYFYTDDYNVFMTDFRDSINPLVPSSDHLYHITSISYTDDNRLKLYKLWSTQNGDSLVVDLSAFRSYTPAAAYEFSEIVITLTSNGVDTDYNLPLSSSTVNNGWDNNSNLYTISTPVSDFTLSDTYDTYVSKVSFSLDVSSPGGSGSTPFYISTNFPLDVHHSSVIPGAVPTPVLENPTIKFDSEISTIIGELNIKSSSSNNGQFDYSSSYNVPSWADNYQETLYRFTDNSSSSVAGQFVNKIPFENGIVTNYQVIDIFDYLSSIIDSLDNSYDVFVFPVDVWYVSDVVTTPNYTDNGISYYIIFYTTRYFQRQNSLTDIDILYVLQKDANNFVDFVEYMQVRLDDFESKSLEILNPLYDETTYIDDKLASILYAVNNLESYNDSSIVSLLTDIKGLLSSPANEIDTPQECIQLYEAHPDYFNELWGTPTRSNAANNQFSGSEYVRADLVPAWWEGKTLTMIYILKNDGETSRFYNDILNGLFDSYENLIESDNSFNTFIDSLFKTGYDYTDSFYGHLFDLSYNPESWDGGFAENE